MVSPIDVWTILIIISLAHSVFVINFLFIKKEHKRTEGKWLLLLLLVLFWLQIEFLLIRWPHNIGLTIFYGTRHGSWLLVGPVFFFYFKSLLRKDIKRKEYGYLIPFVVSVILLPLLLNDFLTFRQVHYGMLTPFDNWPDTINFWQYLYSVIFVGQFIYLLFFLVKSGILIQTYKKDLKESFAELEVRKLRWLKIMWYGMLLILLLASSFLVLLFLTEIYRRHMDYLYVIPSSVLIYVISYRLFGVSFQKAEVGLKYQKSGLRISKVNEYKQQLQNLMKMERLYLKNGLKLNDVSKKLNLPSHQLSELLNKHMNTTFFDFINKYRVEEAKRQIRENPQFTLLQIGYASGFNNKTSFVNAFKRFEGRTPSSYMKKAE